MDCSNLQNLFSSQPSRQSGSLNLYLLAGQIVGRFAAPFLLEKMFVIFKNELLIFENELDIFEDELLIVEDELVIFENEQLIFEDDDLISQAI